MDQSEKTEPRNIYIEDGFTYVSVGSVAIEEDGIITNCGRDYYKVNNLTKDWILYCFYDSINKKWIDV